MDDELVSTELISAAGGLLWRRTMDGYELVVIHRRRYDDWTLPKGKLNVGESPQPAALREVHEETGYKASIVGVAGVVAYPTDKGLKVVRYWHMEVTDMAQSPLDPEVSEVFWFPVEQALAHLQYPVERALVEAWQAPGQFAS